MRSDRMSMLDDVTRASQDRLLYSASTIDDTRSHSEEQLPQKSTAHDSYTHLTSVPAPVYSIIQVPTSPVNTSIVYTHPVYPYIVHISPVYPQSSVHQYSAQQISVANSQQPSVHQSNSYQPSSHQPSARQPTAGRIPSQNQLASQVIQTVVSPNNVPTVPRPPGVNVSREVSHIVVSPLQGASGTTISPRPQEKLYSDVLSHNSNPSK